MCVCMSTVGGLRSRLVVSDSNVFQGEYVYPSRMTLTNGQQETGSTTKSSFSGSTSEEMERVFGPDQSGSSTTEDGIPSDSEQHSTLVNYGNHTREEAADRGGVVKPCGQGETASSRGVVTCNSPEPGHITSTTSQDIKECVISQNEIVPSNTDVASSNSSDLLVNQDHKHVNNLESCSPQHSRVDLSEAEDAREHVTAALKGDDSEDEMISQEARALIADEILKEFQQSSSFIAGSSISLETPIHNSVIIEVSQLTHPAAEQEERTEESATPTPALGHSDGLLLAHDRSSKTKTKNVPTGEGSHDIMATSLSDVQAAAGSELSAKSSSIFVDMSTLHLDQVQTSEEVADQNSNN